MGAVEPETKARRSWSVPLCAVGAALLVAGLLAACLNPMPEEFPSGRETAVIGPPTPGAGASSGATGSPTPGSDGNGVGGLVDEDNPENPTEAPAASGGANQEPEADPSDAGADGGGVSPTDE